MGIFKKFADLARANINSLIDQLEDPQKMTTQAILDLQENKKKAHKLLVSATAAKKKAEASKLNFDQEIAQHERDAEQFLKNGDDESAKRALEKKHLASKERAIYVEQLAQEEKTIATINRGLVALDDKIQALKSSAGVQAGKQELEKDDAFATFARMEEKIETKEFEVQALNELLDAEEKNDARAKTPFAQASFDKHSDPAALANELAAMKKKLSDS